jgi:hypothetical protein
VDAGVLADAWGSALLIEAVLLSRSEGVTCTFADGFGKPVAGPWAGATAAAIARWSV